MTDTMFGNSTDRWMCPNDRPIQFALELNPNNLNEWMCDVSLINRSGICFYFLMLRYH
uniref:Uncharacterized protein n=1 Tax=Terrapene triunguis TaxID=2587831 RepID=A0A674K982_9SAUR